MNLNNQTYNEFWLERLSWKAKEQGKDSFTKEEIEWALRQVDDHRFGDCELDDRQKIAVDVLVWCTGQYISANDCDDDNPTYWGE